MLFGVLSGSSPPFFAVRRNQTDGQAGLINHIGHAALSGAALQPAQLGILSAELGQPALQIGIEGIDTGGVLRLVPVDNGFFLILRQLRHTDPPHIDGQYVIDAPSISDCDIPPFLSALGEKPLWFIEDIELLFDKICIHSTHDAINAAAFRRIGYILHTAYAYKASYGTAMNFFDDVIFCQDIVDLSTLDRRISNLSMFGSALDKKKKSLDYIETAPKVLMSRSKVEEVYGLTTADIRELQSTLSVYYEIPFFNGRSIWHKIQDLPIVKKLQGNDWMLTCIMRQQDSVASISVAGGIILSLESTSLSLSRICEWISSEYGTMSINALEKRFNELFGTRIPASKLAEKLKTSGSWRNVVTDSMDDYIDSLVDADIIDMDANDLLHEEFF